jgi:glutamate synthase (NADPH/NADH) small chain
MPGSSKEVKHAEEEGVEFIFNTQPVEVEGNGSVKKLKIVTTKYDENKKSLVEQSGSEKLIDVDRLIVAFGYSASPQDFFIKKGVEIDKDGLVKLDRNEYKYQTSNEKFFAGGDMIMGSSLAVYAIAHGRDAAKEIINFLKSN